MMVFSPARVTKTNLIPAASAINPPAIGPITGPIYHPADEKLIDIDTGNVPTRGPRVYTAIADARSRGAKQSLIDPAPQAIGVLPENPAGSKLAGKTIP